MYLLHTTTLSNAVGSVSDIYLLFNIGGTARNGFMQRNWVNATDIGMLDKWNTKIGENYKKNIAADQAQDVARKSAIETVRAMPAYSDAYDNSSQKVKGLMDELDGTDKKIKTSGQKVGDFFKNIGTSLLNAGAMTVAMLAISKGIELISNEINKQEIAIAKVEETTEAYEAVSNELNSAIEERASIQKRLAALDTSEAQTAASRDETSELTKQNIELTRKIELLEAERDLKNAERKEAIGKTDDIAQTSDLGTSYTATGEKLSWWQKLGVYLSAGNLSQTAEGAQRAAEMLAENDSSLYSAADSTLGLYQNAQEVIDAYGSNAAPTDADKISYDKTVDRVQ